MVELSAGPPPEGPLIVFQTRLGPPSQQDIELGIAGYSLSDERGATVYDGLVRCELRADSLEMELSDVAVDLGFDREIAFSLDPEQGFAEVLGPLLHRIINRPEPSESPAPPAG